MIQNTLRTQLAGFAHQLGCKSISISSTCLRMEKLNERQERELVQFYYNNKSMIRSLFENGNKEKLTLTDN